MCVCRVFVLNSDITKSLVFNQWWRPPRFPFSPVRWNTAGRLPYNYHSISITLLRHSLARCLLACYQLIERFNPQSAPIQPPFPPLPPSVHWRCVFHLSKADVIEVEHWTYQLNEITQMPITISWAAAFRELLLWNLAHLHWIQIFWNPLRNSLRPMLSYVKPYSCRLLCSDQVRVCACVSVCLCGKRKRPMCHHLLPFLFCRAPRGAKRDTNPLMVGSKGPFH